MTALLGISIQGLLLWLIARYNPCNARMPFLSRDLIIDAAHCMLSGLYAGLSVGVLIIFTGLVAYGGDTSALDAAVSIQYDGNTAPIALQVLLMFFIADLITFFWHRIFHSAQLWKFHKLHHSTVHMDWC